MLNLKIAVRIDHLLPQSVEMYTDFIDACRAGDLARSQAICPPPDQVRVGYAALKATCEGGESSADKTSPRIAIPYGTYLVAVNGDKADCSHMPAESDAKFDGDEPNSLETIKWLLEYFQFQPINHPTTIGLVIVRHSCLNTNTTIFKWVQTTEFAPPPLLIWEFGNFLMELAMQHENQAALDQLRNTYAITFESIAEAGYWCCLDVRTWRDPIIADDLGTGYNAFRTSCELGLDSAIRQLIQLGFAAAARHACEALFLAKLNGHRHLARELQKYTSHAPELAPPEGHTASMSNTGTFRMLRYFCARGRLDLAQRMVRQFSTTRELVRSHNNSILRLTLTGGHLEVADWLMTTFALTVNDVRADCGYVMRYIRRRHTALLSGCITEERARRRALLHRRGLPDPEDAKDRDHLRVLTWLVVNFDESFIAFMRAICEPEMGK